LVDLELQERLEDTNNQLSSKTEQLLQREAELSVVRTRLSQQDAAFREKIASIEREKARNPDSSC